MKIRSLLRDQRGGNPFVGAIILMTGVLIFLLLYAYLAMPVREVFGATENASTNPNAPASIWSDLDLALIAIPVIALVAIVIWFLAYILSSEREAEVYLGG